MKKSYFSPSILGPRWALQQRHLRATAADQSWADWVWRNFCDRTKEDSKIVSTLKRQRTEDTIEELQVFDTSDIPGTSNDPYQMIENPEKPRVIENPEQVHPIPHKERIKFPVQTKIEILEFIDSLPPDPKGKPRSSYELAQLIRSQFQRYIDHDYCAENSEGTRVNQRKRSIRSQQNSTTDQTRTGQIPRQCTIEVWGFCFSWEVFISE